MSGTADAIRRLGSVSQLTCCVLGGCCSLIRSFCWTTLSYVMSFCATTRAYFRT